jgi:hypothetical protein
MATWIAHLRIAEILLQKLPILDEVSFLYGNLAPDSGLPNEDWTLYDPPKEVTHFLTEGHGEEDVRDLIFYRQYLQNKNLSRQTSEYSFRLGYFVHLLADQFWWKKIGITMEAINQELFTSHSRVDAIGILKTDWYDLDHKYLHDHSDWGVWKTFYESEFPKVPLPFLPQNAFEIQMKYIKEYYTTPDPARKLDRAYPYLNEKILGLFIRETSKAIFQLIQLVDENIFSITTNSSLTLLSPEESAAYYPPLGDL